MSVEILKEQDEKKWDKFVLNSESSTFCHLMGWRRVIKKSYGHQDLYLVAEERERIGGILPAFIVRNVFFGKKIVSLPFFTYGGIIAENKETQDILEDFLKKHTRENKYDFFELRSVSPNPSLSVDLSQFTFVLELDQNQDVLWSRMSKKVRNQIRKANKFDLQIKIGNQYLKEFYKLYQKTMKRLGTPVHSFSFFENVIKEFPDQVRIFMAKFENKFVASLFLFNFKDTVSNLWGVSDNTYSTMNPNNYLYWETIKYVSKQGFKYFDFGRSQINSGTFHFKKQWGGEIKQLYYQHYFSQKVKAFSNKKKYSGFSKVWKKLPMVLVNLIGPILRKYIP